MSEDFNKKSLIFSIVSIFCLDKSFVTIDIDGWYFIIMVLASGEEDIFIY